MNRELLFLCFKKIPCGKIEIVPHPRSKFCRKYNVRNAVNSVTKTFLRKSPASFCNECDYGSEFLEDFRFWAVIFSKICDFLRWNSFFSPHSPDFSQKINTGPRARISNILYANNFLFYCTICHLILCELKSYSKMLVKTNALSFVRFEVSFSLFSPLKRYQNFTATNRKWWKWKLHTRNPNFYDNLPQKILTGELRKTWRRAVFRSDFFLVTFTDEI